MMMATPVRYDIVGDIHGHGAELHALLKELGYEHRQGAYRHSERKAIFLGDFIDRGPDTQGVMATVRSMVEAGSALAVMGNHEFNALAYHTPHPERPGDYLRARSEKNTHQHRATLDQLAGRSPDSMLAWFYSLPLWLDLGDLRIVHACWDDESMAILQGEDAVDEQNRLKPSALHGASTKGHSIFKAVEVVLKGWEVILPNGLTYTDKEGNVRHEVRIRWWDAASKTTWRDLALGGRELAERLPADQGPNPPIQKSYPKDAPPVFVGHYWLTGEPEPLAPNVACVDYSVAKPHGSLAAYRWDGESALSAEKFVTITRRH